MFDGRHVDEKTSRQRDVRRNARAFFGNGLFRDLNEYLLTFAPEIRDRRLMSLASRLVTTITTLIALPR